MAGGPESIARMKQLRAYAGAPLPLPLQRVAEGVWADEAHVVENRALYAEKYALADGSSAMCRATPRREAGCFLWLPVADGEAAALQALAGDGVRVLPGAYLSREDTEGKPRAGLYPRGHGGPAGRARRADAHRDCLYGDETETTRRGMAYQARGAIPCSTATPGGTLERAAASCSAWC